MHLSSNARIFKLASKDQIHRFALLWMSKFQDTNTTYHQLVDRTLARDCQALGFVMDGGKAFQAKYGDAIYDYKALRLVIDDVTDIELLGSAIYSQWHYFDFRTNNAETIVKHNNRTWFTLAFNRLAELTE